MLQAEEAQKLADKIKADNAVDFVLHLKVEHDGQIFEALAIPPPPGVHARFKNLMMDDRQKSTATGFLCKQVIKWPDAAGLGELLKRKPGIVDPFAERILQESGDLLVAEAKKL